MANKLTIYFSSKFIDFGRTLNSRNSNAPPGLGIPRNARSDSENERTLCNER
jgi:hypothetical protein